MGVLTFSGVVVIYLIIFKEFEFLILNIQKKFILFNSQSEN